MALERHLDRTFRIGEKSRHARQRFVRLGVEYVEDGADQQGVTGLFPMVAAFERSLRIDQDIGDVLDVPDFPFAASDFKQGVIGCRVGIGRIEQQHSAMPGAKTRRQCPVLAFDVMDDTAIRPGQQGRHDQTHPLPGPCRREAEDMLGSIMSEVILTKLAEHDTVRRGETSSVNFERRGPAGRAVGGGCLGFARAPYRHADRHCDRDEAARSGDIRTLNEDVWGVGVVGVPPPKEGRRQVDRHAGKRFAPWLSKLRLIA